jgi:hypothetical protein
MQPETTIQTIVVYNGASRRSMTRSTGPTAREESRVAQAFLAQALALKTTADVTTVDGGNVTAALR